jgi:DNA-binding transcriptional MerR regulator
MNATMLRKALEMGLTLEQVCELVDAWEEGSALPVPTVSQAAIRQRRYRDRKASEGAERNVSVTSDATCDAPPETKGFPHPSKNSTPVPPPIVPPPCPKTALAKAIWGMQPLVNGKRRATLPDVETALDGVLRRKAVPDEVRAGCSAYYALPDSRKDGGEFAMGAARLLQRDRWREFLPKPKRVTPGASEAAVRNRVERWIELGEWRDDWGPPPKAPGCTVPPTILAEYRIAA